MRIWILTVVLSFVAAAAAIAGKNAGGVLVVHTYDGQMWYRSYCEDLDGWIPPLDCWTFNTRTDLGPSDPAMIWFIAAFDSSSNPGVTAIHFGNDHNLPEGYHSNWGLCGPPGTVEHPDPGWPEDPGGAGNWIEFGSPVVNDLYVPFYRVNVWGFDGAYYGTGIHPGLGYGSFSDDSDPPVVDEVWGYGQVRWYERGHNTCPGSEPQDLAACCFFETSECWVLHEPYCADHGGESQGLGTDCDPNPCVPIGVCCLETGDCLLETELVCQALWGTFLPDENQCDPNPCPQPPIGACCLDTDDCVLETELACQALGGVFLPEENQCDPNPCPQYLIGACCLESGACRVEIEPACATLGGQFLAGVTACTPDPCYGACCFYYGCVMQSAYWCEPMGGEYMGAGSDCDPDPCDPTSNVPEMLIRESTWGAIKARYR